jgi:hypothetical protein
MKVLLAWSGITAAVTMLMSSPVVDAHRNAPSATPTGRVALPTFLARPITPAVEKVAPAHTRYGSRVRYGARGIAVAALDSTIARYCGSCHNPTMKRGNLNLRGFGIDSSATHLDVAEKMIRKLRAEMMPPPGSKRPTGDTLLALVETLERTVDVIPTNPGTRTFQRLNRAEYERVVKELLGLDVHAGDWLPLDQKSANFDNISDVQAISPTLLEGYLNASAAIVRMALGDRKAVDAQVTFKPSIFVSQHPWDRVDGTPYGTRGGMVVKHVFPADGEYDIRVNIGGGVGRPVEDVDVSIDGVRVKLLAYDKGVSRNNESADLPLGADYLRTGPQKISAGQHTVSVAFVRRAEGPYEDLIKPHDWSRASGGTASAGTTEPTYLMDFTISGPTKVTGIGNSPQRAKVFSCAPTAAAAQRVCAETILARMASRAYRRPLSVDDRADLMKFYDRAATADNPNGFEDGVRLGLQAILSSPYFVFRFERTPTTVAEGKDYRIDDLELATRLSFFLWSTIPDERLLSLAKAKTLHTPAVYQAEVKRMLADPRSEALASRFAAQWLRLQDLEKVQPDAFIFPDFDQSIANAMYKETELFFNDIVRKDKSVLALLTSDSTFVNDKLARHYGIPNVTGSHFRQVAYVDEQRRGILGQGSVLVQTSLGNRTSPVLRGKWVMEVLLGAPPPPPPPNVPDLEQTEGSKGGRQLTTRERMEMHRANPTCKSCHQFMDPIGLALDNFDVTGRQRYRENGAKLDTRGELYDGTSLNTPTDLANALLKRPLPLMRNFTENLMTYALGRRVEDPDQPTVRAIVNSAAKQNYRMSAFVMGVVTSKAFTTRRAESAVANDAH